MGRWLVVVVGCVAVLLSGCKRAAPPTESREHTGTWGKGFASVALAYTSDGNAVPVPDLTPESCRCNGTGRVVQPDGHETDCLCGGPGKCKCKPVAAAAGSVSRNELEWCKTLAADLGCEAGVEVRIATGTRVDLMSDQWAIEVDWAPKWAEGCGQALYYGICTGRKSGLLLLLRSPADKKYIDRAAVVAGKHGIGLWVYDTQREKWLVMFQRGKGNGRRD